MVLVNEEELRRHQIESHLKNNHQCQSCNQVFENKEDFDKHVIEMHGGEEQLKANFAKTHRFQKDLKDVESMAFGNAVNK